jgi:hypothetical protein
MGKLITDIVKQSPQLNQHNKQSSNYTLIRATKWWISTPSTGEIGSEESSQEQQQSIDIQFNISSVTSSVTCSFVIRPTGEGQSIRLLMLFSKKID